MGNGKEAIVEWCLDSKLALKLKRMKRVRVKRSEKWSTYAGDFSVLLVAIVIAIAAVFAVVAQGDSTDSKHSLVNSNLLYSHSDSCNK